LTWCWARIRQKAAHEAGLASGGTRSALALSESELELLGTKTGATRLSFAILLKAFQFDGRFPDRREDVAGGIVAHLASQTGVPQEAYFEGEWSERTQRYQPALIREHCGFRAFRAQDESS
jgi:Domain of unknown function (DUF4158)